VSSLAQQNRRDEATAAYRRVLALDATAPIAANNLAWLLMEDNQHLDAALQLAQAAKSRVPESADIADALGWLHFKKGLTAQAIDELGYFDLAQKTLQAALKLNPNAPDAAEARSVLGRLGTR
jgi:Flp pilus assembly protein TadD